MIRIKTLKRNRITEECIVCRDITAHERTNDTGGFAFGKHFTYETYKCVICDNIKPVSKNGSA